MAVRIINSDVMDGLRQLEDESVHCCVTSPPYWGLRDYGVEGQIGMESCIADHIRALVEVFREARRVLRKDGTLWVNYGDCYATAPNGRSAADTKTAGKDDRTFRDKPFSTVGPIDRGKRNQSRWGGGNNSDETLKPKDLCGLPWRLAFALQNDGWWLRSDIIWAKPNPMPESVTDRPTKSHEYIFLLTKAEKYFYDAEAIAESAIYSPDTTTEVERAKGYYGGKWTAPSNGKRNDGAFKAIRETRNKRSIWTIATSPFPEAHFATFPPELPEICIKAGCPKGGTVLDPFGGAGTTGLVADRLQRNAILIELNPEYAAMAEKRINSDRGGLLDIMETA
jgi:DNA modification methylase